MGLIWEGLVMGDNILSYYSSALDVMATELKAHVVIRISRAKRDIEDIAYIYRLEFKPAV